MKRLLAVLLFTVVVATGVASTVLTQGQPDAAPPRPAAFASADAVQAALTTGLPCEPVMTYNKYTSSCSIGSAVLTFGICNPDDGHSQVPRFGSLLTVESWCVSSADPAALRAAQKVLGGDLSTRPAVASGRMQGYIPPCRVVTPAGSALTFGVHLDANGHCPRS